MTVGEARRWALQALRVDNPRQESDWLLCALLKMDTAQLLMAEKKPLSELDEATFHGWLAERTAGRPLQYILGEWPFMGLSLSVQEGVLIPREDSETLVRTALASVDGLKMQNATALDLCTGSGAIAIALAKWGGLSSVDAVDISEEACLLARDNAARNGMMVNVFQEDVLSEDFWMRWQAKGKPYDIITANPPYISAQELSELGKEVRNYEPLLALDGGEDGLDFYRCFAKSAKALLSAKGIMATEIGHLQAVSIEQIFVEAGWGRSELFQDQNGKDRVFVVRR